MLTVFINHLAFDHDLISKYIKMYEPGPHAGSSNAANGIQVQVPNTPISLPLSKELPARHSSPLSLTPSRYKLFRFSLIYLIRILAKLKYINIFKIWSGQGRFHQQNSVSYVFNNNNYLCFNASLPAAIFLLIQYKIVFRFHRFLFLLKIRGNLF